MRLPRLHIVTDDAVLQASDFLDRAAAVLERCGTRVALQLRGHATSGAALYARAEPLAALALRTGAWLFVNDRVDIARAARAHGAQLGRRSIPIADARALLGRGARIGYSAHGAIEAGAAAVEGADFIVVGTIYASRTHADVEPAGVERITACVAAAGVPVLAIGGITPDRVGAVMAAGAYGIAVIGGVWHDERPDAAAAAYLAALEEGA